MLLARRGLRVLVVDPAREGSDTLSTHAMMRGGVLQLHRWGLLERIRASGAPAIRRTTFHYGSEILPVEIKPKDGVDALYAPRRTVLDSVLVGGAREAGADVRHGHALVDLVLDSQGRVTGAVIADAERRARKITAELVIGADGIRSKVARRVGAQKRYEASHTACSIYGYVEGHPFDGYHWYWGEGAAAGAIPTHDATCVFAGVPGSRVAEVRGDRLHDVYLQGLRAASPDLEALVAAVGTPTKLRAFPGVPSYLRESVGPGWALVGDAAYFRDPITAHGMTDALREAELLTHAVINGGLGDYQAARDARVRGMLDVTDRIAALDWTLDEVKAHHVELNVQMNSLIQVVRELEPEPLLAIA
jgi:2-polyprenyl-6-methoxyphenol hydroxylase-like FAD-dependent oxidoreductase